MSIDLKRIAVLIGKNGATKKKLEELTGTKIIINSTTGEYNIVVDQSAETKEKEDELEPMGIRVYLTNNILQAINHGFNPEKALKLLDQEFVFEIIDLEKIVGHSLKKLKRIKGRIIGDKGKIRNSIEQFTKIHLSLEEKTIAIIGDFESIRMAKKAINMLIQGAPHKTVLGYLQRKHQERKREDFTKMWHPTI
jgi:ribosomal RNA assembly protein